MSDNERQKYAEEWNKSAKYFYENDDYQWMSDCIERYKSVLEIGCGTGQSTLALLKKGHKVVAVDKNKYCIEKAQQLIGKDYTYGTSLSGFDEFDVIFIEGDISDDIVTSSITKDFFDVVICWNIGSYWSRKMIEFYAQKLLNYGLTKNEILENPESSYSEYLIWLTCKIGNKFCKPVHLIERLGNIINEDDKEYYNSLKKEFSFSQVKYDCKETFAKSEGGRILSHNQKQCRDERLKIILASILYEI